MEEGSEGLGKKRGIKATTLAQYLVSNSETSAKARDHHRGLASNFKKKVSKNATHL